MRMLPLAYASSWNMQMEAISTTKSFSTRSQARICLRKKCGTSSFRLSEVYKRFMSSKLSIEISSAQTFSWRRKVCSSLEISTSLRSLKEVCFKLKQELPTTLLLRFGRTSLMTLKVTFGASDVYFMRCVPWTHLSELKTWMDCVRRSVREFIRLYQTHTHRI